MISFLTGFFKESSNSSMMRLCQFLVVLAVLLVFVGGNVAMIHRAWIDAKTPITLVNISYEMVGLIMVAIAGKVGQKWLEGKPVDDNKPEEPPKP